MALTDVKKSQEAVWVRCDVPGFEDEEHLLLPYTHEKQNDIAESSMAREWRNNTIVHEFNRALFEPSFLKHIWKDWRGIPDPDDPGTRLKGPGIVHDDGRVEWPAACTEQNKLILALRRPAEFSRWLTDT